MNVFIEGEAVALLVPTAADMEALNWAQHTNNVRHVAHMPGYGQFPVSDGYNLADALDLARDVEGRKLLFLLIRHKASGEIVGSTSLSRISSWQRQAVNGLMIVEGKKNDLLAALEAKALICEHGFTALGLERIEGWQHEALMRWQDAITILGFLPEGYLANKFRKGARGAHAYMNACTHTTYERLRAQRGAYWPGRKAAKAMVAKALKAGHASRLRASVEALHAEILQGL